MWNDALERELRQRIVAEYRRTRKRRYQAQCEGKHGFLTAMQAHGTMRHNDMQAFHCRFCGLWHVAQIDRRRRLRGANRSKDHA